MAPVINVQTEFSFVELPYPKRVHSIEEDQEIIKKAVAVLSRQNSAAGFPEQQDAKEVSSIDEWKQSLTLFLTQTPVRDTRTEAVPVEHPLSPLTQKLWNKNGGKLDQWSGVSIGLDDEVPKKNKSWANRAPVEHDLDVDHVMVESSDDEDIEKLKAKSQDLFPYEECPAKVQAENVEKRSISCTEDNYYRQEPLVVELPPQTVTAEVPAERHTDNDDNIPISGEENTTDGKQNIGGVEDKSASTKLLRRSPRRHAAGKAKRNFYFVTDPSPPPPPKKRKKAKEKPQKRRVILNRDTCEDVPEVQAQVQIQDKLKILKAKRPSIKQDSKRMKSNEKCRRTRKQNVTKIEQQKTETHDSLGKNVDQAISELQQLVKRAEMYRLLLPGKSQTVVQSANYHTRKKSGREKNRGASESEPTDSGVDSGSLEGHGSNSGSGDGGGMADGGGTGGGDGGGGFGGWNNNGNGKGGGGGGGGGDDDDKEKKQWRDGGQLIEDSEEKMEEEEEELDTSVDNKAPVGVPQTNCSTNASATPMIRNLELDNEAFKIPEYGLQDVRHAAYCRQPCQNVHCQVVKSDLKHLSEHKANNTCARCTSCHNIIAEHAKTCGMPACRVPFCADLKKFGKKASPKPATPVVVRPALQQYVNIQQRQPSPLPSQYSTPPSTRGVIDGMVILQNSEVLPSVGGIYQEETDYFVQRNPKELLGKGTNGKVYKVLTSDHTELAMKETNYPIGREEISVYKNLGTEHENIVTHHGVTFKGSDGKACIFMEKCDKSLWNVLDDKPSHRFDVEEAMYYMCQVLEAVEFMHNKSMIHRDIKAKNVMLLKAEDFVRAKLGDMDSAEMLVDEFTRSGKRVGTPGFAAPEVLRTEPHGRPADIYSLGCFMLELTVGVPSDTEPLQHKIALLKQKDAELAQIVEFCVRDNSEHRPTAKDLLEHPRIKKYKMEQVAAEV